MKSYQAVLTVALSLCTGLASAQTTHRAFDINLNDDAARAALFLRAGNPKLLADLGWLHHQTRGDVIHVGIHLVDEASDGKDPLQAGLGVRFVYTQPNIALVDGGALALGGFVRYTLPNANRFNVGGYLYYAPDVVSFGDVQEYYEVGARVGYNVVRDADVYLGVRSTKADYGGPGRFSFDSGLHIGFEIRF